jgi:hypothetical protein
MKSLFLSAALIAFAAPAYAIDFSALIMGPTGTPMRSCEKDTPECAKPATLGQVVAGVLLGAQPEEERGKDPAALGVEKARKGRIAVEIINGGEHDFPAEDIAMMKSLIGKYQSPIVVMRSFDLLDPPKPAVAKEK